VGILEKWADLGWVAIERLARMGVVVLTPGGASPASTRGDRGYRVANVLGWVGWNLNSHPHKPRVAHPAASEILALS
jgi:hypothetical protein